MHLQRELKFAAFYSIITRKGTLNWSPSENKPQSNLSESQTVIVSCYEKNIYQSLHFFILLEWINFFLFIRVVEAQSRAGKLNSELNF